MQKIKTWIAKIQDLNIVKRFGPNEDADKARTYAHRIQRELDRMKLCYKSQEWARFGQKVTRIQHVEFETPLIVTPSTIRLKVDIGTLPTGITIANLTKPDLADTLSFALKREVMVTCPNPRAGLYFEVSEDSTIRGIPGHIWANDVTLPLDSPPLAFVVGISRRGAVIVDLESISHYLVAGATRQGKSIHLWHILTTLASHNQPHNLLIVLFDLKNGVMFFPFRNLPHLWRPVTDHPDRCLTVFDALIEEMNTRYTTIRDRGQATVTAYNLLNGIEKIPPLVVFIDELAVITKSRILTADNRPLGKEANERLALLLQQGAGAGIHFIVATQDPRVEVLSGDIRANITEAIAFKTSKSSHSEIIIGCSGAERIQNKGRALLKMGADVIELQTPRILEEGGKHGVYQAVSAIVQKWNDHNTTTTEPTDHQTPELDLTAQMIDYSLKYLAGNFRVREIYAAFKSKVSCRKVELIAQDLEKTGVLSAGRRGVARKVIAPPVSITRQVTPDTAKNDLSRSTTCLDTCQVLKNSVTYDTPPDAGSETSALFTAEPLTDDEIAALVSSKRKQPEVVDV